MPLIDMRSDFLAPPSEAMGQSAVNAANSLCFGLREDPWQQRLEARIAQLLEKEDALIFPTCTMANTTALMAQAAPGSSVLVSADAHMLLSEANAAAALAGVGLRCVAAGLPSSKAQGWLAPITAWADVLNAGADEQRAPIQMCVLENTHNRAGGWAVPAVYVDAVARAAHLAGARLHVDGARLFYAAASLELEPARLVKDCDSVAVSLNKHTGSPIAAALVGSKALIERALVIRQRLGGGIRPVGPACAAALQGIDELGEVKAVIGRTRRLAQALSVLPPFAVAEPERCTNLIVVRLADHESARRALVELERHGLRALLFGDGCLRLALHRGISDTCADAALAAATAAARAL